MSLPRVKVVLLLFAISSFLRADAAIFSYDQENPYGPRNWNHISENCDGKHQSPVNLYEKNALPAPKNPLIIDGYSKRPTSVLIRNTGHSVEVSFKFPDDQPVMIHGGPLKLPYILAGIHWHWGEHDFAGSEHALNAVRFAAEMHLVTYNSQYQSLVEAATMPNGLAVIGFLYEVSESFDEDLSPIVKLLTKVVEIEKSHNETEDVFSVSDLIKMEKFPFLSYEGSLTTPKCLETVTWMVSTKTLQITSTQLAEFRKFKDGHGELLLKNNRPLQSLNYRDVWKYSN